MHQEIHRQHIMVIATQQLNHHVRQYIQIQHHVQVLEHMVQEITVQYHVRRNKLRLDFSNLFFLSFFSYNISGDIMQKHDLELELFCEKLTNNIERLKEISNTIKIANVSLDSGIDPIKLSRQMSLLRFLIKKIIPAKEQILSDAISLSLKKLSEEAFFTEFDKLQSKNILLNKEVSTMLNLEQDMISVDNNFKR